MFPDGLFIEVFIASRRRGTLAPDKPRGVAPFSLYSLRLDVFPLTFPNLDHSNFRPFSFPATLSFFPSNPILEFIKTKTTRTESMNWTPTQSVLLEAMDFFAGLSG